MTKSVCTFAVTIQFALNIRRFLTLEKSLRIVHTDEDECENDVNIFWRLLQLKTCATISWRRSFRFQWTDSLTSFTLCELQWKNAIRYRRRCRICSVWTNPYPTILHYMFSNLYAPVLIIFKVNGSSDLKNMEHKRTGSRGRSHEHKNHYGN